MLEFFGGCLKGPVCYAFLIGPEMKGKLKIETETRKERLAWQGRRQRWGPAEAFGVSQSQLEFAKNVPYALPLQAGGGGC